MKPKLLLPLVLLILSACSVFGPTAEDTSALQLATEKLEEAREKTFAAHEQRLKIFRDELIKRALGEIEQARQDEIHKLQMAVEVKGTDANGEPMSTWQPGVLEPAKVDAINAQAKKLTDDAIKHIMDGWDAAHDLAAERDFEDIYASLRMYWITRLGTDGQKQALIEQIKDLVKKKQPAPAPAPAPSNGGK